MVPLAVVAFSHVLSMQFAAVDYAYNYVQTLAPFIPLKFKQDRFVPIYIEQGAEISTQPAPVVTQPASVVPHSSSVVRIFDWSVQSLFEQVVVHVHDLKKLLPPKTYYYLFIKHYV